MFLKRREMFVVPDYEERDQIDQQGVFMAEEEMMLTGGQWDELRKAISDCADDYQNLPYPDEVCKRLKVRLIAIKTIDEFVSVVTGPNIGPVGQWQSL